MPPPELRIKSARSRLISCYAYSGGYRWHWRQTHDSFPGQPVVLVHGLIGSSVALLPLADSIASWVPVFVPDLPGFGLSSGGPRALTIPELAAALSEWMKVAGAYPAHVIGNSCGCQVAAELAVRFPVRVRSLTLVGPTIDPSARNAGSLISRTYADVRQEPVELWKGYFREYSRTGLARTVANCRAIAHDRIETKLPRIKVASLVLRGALDSIAPESWTQSAAQLLPQATALSLSDGAHWVPFSHPALVASAVRDFTFSLRNGSRQAQPIPV